MIGQARFLVAGQPWEPSLPLPDGPWVGVGRDGRRTLLPGLASVGGRLVVVLPRPYLGVRSSPDELLQGLNLFVGCLSRYARDRAGNRAVVEPFGAAREDPLLVAGEALDLVDRVEAALLLWQDFARDGRLCLTSARVHDQTPGRVLWSQVLRLGAPIESPSGVVFRSLTRRSVRPDPRHELTELHEATCRAIGAQFGLGPPSPGPTAAHEAGPVEALARIERGERSCFADRPRRVLGLLRRYLTGHGAGVGETGLRGLFARSYAYVWERMLQVALGSEGRGAGLRGAYTLLDGTRAPSAGLNLLPDLVVRARRPDGRPALLVLDAKDYAADALPGTGDLGKQILYRVMLSNLIVPTGLPLADVGNAFLFPARVPGSHAGAPALRVRALHDLTGPQMPGQPGRVVCLDVDVERVGQAYLAGRNDAALRDAIALATFGASPTSAPGPAVASHGFDDRPSTSTGAVEVEDARPGGVAPAWSARGG